jgi:hypothetical protein
MWRLMAAASFRWRRGTTQLSALSGAEGDDAADRVVRRYANRDAVAGNNFDSEATHPAAQLRQHLMPRITLHAVQTARVNRNHGSLHIYQIVFAQSGVPLTEEMSGLGRTKVASRVPHCAAACKSRIFSG